MKVLLVQVHAGRGWEQESGGIPSYGVEYGQGGGRAGMPAGGGLQQSRPAAPTGHPWASRGENKPPHPPLPPPPLIIRLEIRW